MNATEGRERERDSDTVTVGLQVQCNGADLPAIQSRAKFTTRTVQSSKLPLGMRVFQLKEGVARIHKHEHLA